MLKRKQERPFSAHHMLISTAFRACEAAEQKSPGYMYNMLVAITFSSLAVESLCNTIGERIILDWQDFESGSPIAKLRLLTKHLNIEFTKESEPWVSARWLIKFRNQIAHAKPENVVEEVTLTQEQHDKRLFDMPESKLEKQVTLANAKRAVETVIQIKTILTQAIPPEDAFGLYVDGWSGSTELFPDA
ncbi:hypothetical protein [Geothrix sp.]|uniref:hypothetical protein n=1 Tax=Geothrix sp. TaxID=1962974 RepID=UPI0025B95B03|nr:hypothetical protein [Geothrix sp.]WIL21378.1 MAG: hypothetical protein QOZ81_000637 [Geothrix sp.]